jgi:hypothetical protein
MAKIKISNTDLVWLFTEKLHSFDECSSTASIAIVPTGNGWKAIANRKSSAGHPRCAERVEQLQRQLQKLYIFAKD